MTLFHSSHVRTVRRSHGGRAFLRRKRSFIALVISGLLMLTPTFVLFHASAASGFATPAFQQQWNAGEAVLPNFWGPVALAKDGAQEPYTEAPGGQRLVQYFDKARMELTNPATNVVTNGLLATELITGNRQLGDNTFQNVGSANVPVAGDPDNVGPTYAAINSNPQLRNGTGSTVGAQTTNALTAAGAASTFSGGASFPPANIAVYDATTQHNVPAAFNDFRNRAGLQAIGFAISEPFWSNVKVAGAQKDVLMQAFERRVLTYTPSNPTAFLVEFGNIGIHYYQWRYVTNPGGGGAPSPSPSPSPSTTPAAGAPTLSTLTLSAITPTGVTVAYTTNVGACGTVEYRVAGTASFTTDVSTIGGCVPNSTFTKALTGLTPATNYELRGAAFVPPGGAIGYSTVMPFTTLALDTTAPTVSAIAWIAVDKNNIKVTFTLNEPGTAKVRYGTAADLTGGTTIDATVVTGNNFSATFGLTRETQYFFQITATDTSGNSGSTLVKQVRLDRTLNFNLQTITVKLNHSLPAVFPFPQCDPSYTYMETVGYATGTPNTKTFSVNEPFAATVPKDYTVNHAETQTEDLSRSITLAVNGVTVPTGNPGCLVALTPATATVTAAQDFQVGQPSVIAESADMKVTFVVTDTLAVTAP